SLRCPDPRQSRQLRTGPFPANGMTAHPFRSISSRATSWVLVIVSVILSVPICPGRWLLGSVCPRPRVLFLRRRQRCPLGHLWSRESRLRRRRQAPLKSHQEAEKSPTLPGVGLPFCQRSSSNSLVMTCFWG